MTLSESAGNENIMLMRNAFATLARRDINAVIEFLTPDFIINLAGVPQQMRGRDAWRKNAQIFFAAFPDIKFEIEDMFASGDRVAVRFRFTGTHDGEFLGTPPTGKRVDYESYRVLPHRGRQDRGRVDPLRHAHHPDPDRGVSRGPPSVNVARRIPCVVRGSRRTSPRYPRNANGKLPALAPARVAPLARLDR